jgi:hypothetical protein
MADALYLILIAGAFAALVGLVRGCDRIVRSGLVGLPAAPPAEAGDGR